MATKSELPPGITRRPSGHYQAQVYFAAENRRASKSFERLADARAWKRDTEAALARGVLGVRATPTLREAGAEWLAAARDGGVRNRSGQRYRPSTLRGYEAALADRLYPALGATKLGEIRSGTLNHLVGKLQAEGLSASTVRTGGWQVLPLHTTAKLPSTLGSRGKVFCNTGGSRCGCSAPICARLSRTTLLFTRNPSSAAASRRCAFSSSPMMQTCTGDRSIRCKARA